MIHGVIILFFLSKYCNKYACEFSKFRFFSKLRQIKILRKMEDNEVNFKFTVLIKMIQFINAVFKN